MSHNQGGEWRCAYCRGKVRLSKLELLVYLVGSACMGAFIGRLIMVTGGG